MRASRSARVCVMSERMAAFAPCSSPLRIARRISRWCHWARRRTSGSAEVMAREALKAWDRGIMIVGTKGLPLASMIEEWKAMSASTTAGTSCPSPASSIRSMHSSSTRTSASQRWTAASPAAPTSIILRTSMSLRPTSRSGVVLSVIEMRVGRSVHADRGVR